MGPEGNQPIGVILKEEHANNIPQGHDCEAGNWDGREREIWSEVDEVVENILREETVVIEDDVNAHVG